MYNHIALRIIHLIFRMLFFSFILYSLSLPLLKSIICYSPIHIFRISTQKNVQYFNDLFETLPLFSFCTYIWVCIEERKK